MLTIMRKTRSSVVQSVGSVVRHAICRLWFSGLRRSTVSRALAAIVSVLFANTASAEYGLNLKPGVTAISHSIYNLHMIIFWICVVIGIVVFGVMIYSILHHRKSRGHEAHDFHESVAIEIVWTVIPFLILIGMAIPATAVLKKMHDTSNSDLTIKVTGYQWKWKYDYPEQGLSYFSNLSTSQDEIHNVIDKGKNYLHEVDKPVVIPVNKKVRFLFTSHDVIHAWWVQDLGVKKDAIPGFINESWAKVDKPGIYRGQCAELCGTGHGYMPIVVKAVTDAEFADWVKSEKVALQKQFEETQKVWTMAELMAKGKKAYLSHCAVCHQANGAGVAGAFPALKGSPIAKGDIKKHEHIVLHGVPGTAMQAFAEQMSNSELAAIITYERNAWGNNTGDLVQPKQIAEAKKGNQSK